MKFDDLIEVEDRLSEGLSTNAEVTGHEIGREEADIFISTADPHATFEDAKSILMSLGFWNGVRAAFRETSGDEYTVLWPETQVGLQNAPSFFSVNTFSLGAQRGGYLPREVSHEEQRMRNAFNVWQGKYTSAVGKFAFLLRVDGPALRYTELFKIRGAQKAKLKKGWVEVEIGIPLSWWHNDDVEKYKKSLSQAIEEGFQSMVEVLRSDSKEVDADALFRDWARVKENFLTSSDN